MPGYNFIKCRASLQENNPTPSFHISCGFPVHVILEIIAIVVVFPGDS